MQNGPSFRHSIATFSRRVVAILTLIVSSLAAAQAVPQIGKTDEEGTSGKHPWRGSTVSYGLGMTALTLAPGFEQSYNGTVAHRIGLMPEWHFSDAFHVRSRFFISQEMTLSDTTTTPHEFELSDLWLDGVWAGYKEKLTGLKVDANFRMTFPTSRVSQMQGRIMTVSPGMGVSRAFPVLSGLVFAYSGRFTYRFNSNQNFQNQGASIVRCGVTTPTPECPAGLASTGLRAIQFDILHGPTVVFLPHPRVTFAVAMFMQYGYLPDKQALPEQTEISYEPAPVDPHWRNFWGSSISVSYQAFDTVGFTLGAFTFSNQLDTQSRYIFPFFNRNTVVSLDMSVDVESFFNNFSSKTKPKEKS